MLSDTDATYVDIYWGCVKTKGKQSPLGRSMAVTKTTTTTTHTHTHTNLTRLNVECAKQLPQFVVFGRSNIQDSSPTVTTTNTNIKKQSPTVSVYPLRYVVCTVEMLLKTWNFRFRHVYCGHCAIESTLYNGYSAILSTVNGYCEILTP